MPVEWKDVVGYEGLYKVSNDGQVYSVINGRNVSLVTGHHGYKRARLRKDKKVKAYYVHRLVAFAFIPNPNGYAEINHKNLITDDNRVENLEWCTRLYNSRYGGRIEKMSQKVVQMDVFGNTINVYNSQADAGRALGISQGSISNACVGRCASAGGYRWRLVENDAPTEDDIENISQKYEVFTREQRLTFRKNLKEIRLSLGMSAREAGEKMGLNRRAYAQMERSSCVAKSSTIIKASDVFGVSLDRLVQDQQHDDQFYNGGRTE